MTTTDVQRRYHDSKNEFVFKNGVYPTRLLISWENWRLLIEPYMHVVMRGPVIDPEGTSYDGLSVLRTYDADVLEVLQ